MVANPTGRPGRLRVVFVDHVARLSGAEIALLRLLPALSTHVDVHVILGEDGRLVERLRGEGIATEVLPMPSRLRDVRRETVRPVRLDARALAHLPGYVLRLRRRLRELAPDLVHTNSLKAALYGGIAGRLAGIPVLWHIRDRIDEDYLPRSAVQLVHAASRVLPAAVIANSYTTLQTLPPLHHASVLYNAIVPDAVEDVPGRASRGEGPLTVGMLGRLTAWKGQDVFLQAFAEAFRGTDVRGRIIGSALFGEEAYADSLRRLAERLGVASQVEFRGFRENIWGELSELDILVHCSVRPEPFGQVVLEGMAAGVPVVAADAGGPAELITNGVDGLLSKPGDAGELATSLRRLAEDPGLRERLAAVAARRASEFTPERTAAALLDVYDTVIKAARRSLRRRR